MTNTQREAIPMPSRDELRKAMSTLDLAICAIEDGGYEVVESQVDALREAHEVLDWFVR